MANVRAGTKVIMMTLAVVGVMATAVVGVPWATGDPPTGTGGGGSGGGGPPGGIADAPEGASMDDGLWSATVGGTEYGGLGAGDVGKLLWQGGKVTRTYVDDAGIPRTVQVCEGFPEITLESTARATEPGSGSATATMDLINCTVTLSELTHTTTGVHTNLDRNPGPQGLSWDGSDRVSALPISWFGSPDGVLFPLESRPGFSRQRNSSVTGRLKAKDFLRLRLTKTELKRRYRISDLETIRRSWDCDANSPARGAGVFWEEDDCDGDAYVSLGRARAWAQGRFHGEIRGTVPLTDGKRARFNRSTRHIINLLLVGTSSHEIRRCTVSPNSIEDLVVTIPFPTGTETLGVQFECDYSSRVASFMDR